MRGVGLRKKSGAGGALPGMAVRQERKPRPSVPIVSAPAAAAVERGESGPVSPRNDASASSTGPVGGAGGDSASGGGGGGGAADDVGGEDGGGAAASLSAPSASSSDGDRLLAKYRKVTSQRVFTLEELRKVCWFGISPAVRVEAWQMLMGYLPTNPDRRAATLERKRQEYRDLVVEVYDQPAKYRSESERALFHQIEIDVPRTCPSLQLFQFPRLMRTMERVLYIWAIRHPASGYVQGINDLVTPFVHVFLDARLDVDVEEADFDELAAISDADWADVEADCFWCLCKLLDGIQDNYTFAQPGIQRLVFKLKELLQRVDTPLHEHVEAQGLPFIQFAFRWFNCLLMREFRLRSIVRMWDTYLSEENGNGFAEFHVYVCTALLTTYSEELRTRDFQELVMFLQDLPTASWGDKEVEMLLSQAFLYSNLFKRASAHLA